MMHFKSKMFIQYSQNLARYGKKHQQANKTFKWHFDAAATVHNDILRLASIRFRSSSGTQIGQCLRVGYWQHRHG